ncbi:MAG: Ig-like domain repeat protein, partial [Terriglobales bacterium]
MKRACFVCLFLSLSAMAFAQSNAIPFVDLSLSPPSVAPGSGAFTLTVTGTGFAPTAVLNWNRSPRLTSVISSTLLTATINPSDVAKAGTGWVTVTNPAPGGGTSNVVYLPVRQSSSSVAFEGVQAFSTSTLAVGDFNNDGELDVVWSGKNNFTLNVALGNGDGTFQASIVSTAAPFPIQQIITGDFNGDGYLDVAVYQDGGNVFFYLGDGTGTLTQAGSVGTSLEATQYIATADFFNRGILDLYVTGCNAGYGWFNIGNWQYIEPLTDCFSQAAIGDFNGDGYLDLANPGVFLNTGTGALQPFVGGGYYGGYGSIAADMNQDGKLDLVHNGCIALGNGDGTFTLAGCGPSEWPTLGVGDFNGDGKLDAALDGTTITILLGTGTGTFSSSFSFGGGAGDETYLGAIGDFNNDGLLDVITGSGFLLLQTAASVTLLPASLTFGPQPVGTASGPQIVQLSTSNALTISSITTSAEFAQTNNCGSSLPAGGSCRISVTFVPSARGAQNGTLTVYDSGNGSPQTVSLSGTGTAVATTTKVTSSSNPSVFGQSVTFTATVASQGPGTPTGTVTFTYGSTTLCNAVALSGGTATCAYSALPVGSDVVTAAYSGDANFASSSGTVSQTVHQASTTLTLISSLNPSGLDSPVTFTATITPQYGGQASGTVSFKDGSTTLGSSAVSGNLSSLTTSGLAFGTHSITAIYSGDSNFTGSTSNTLTQVVTKATTTTTLLSSINPSVQGKPVTFTASVSSLAGTPTGKVQFLNGKTVLATKALTSGSAKYVALTLPPGSNSITAGYEGDSENNGSTSAPVNQFVLAATTTTLTASPNPSKYGQAVTFTVRVTSSIGAPPNGEIVTFKKGTTVLGTGTLSGGTASFMTSTLKVGTNAIKAVYAGDSKFAGSTS